MPERELVRLPPRLSLVGDVPFDGAPISSGPDRGEIVSIAPELSAPQLLAQFRKPPEQFAGGDAFEPSGHGRAAVLRVEGAE